MVTCTTVALFCPNWRRPVRWGRGGVVGGQKDECGSKTRRRDGASIQHVRSSGLQDLQPDTIYRIADVDMK